MQTVKINDDLLSIFLMYLPPNKKLLPNTCKNPITDVTSTAEIISAGDSNGLGSVTINVKKNKINGQLIIKIIKPNR